MRKGSNIILLQVDIQLIQHHWLKRVFFLLESSWDCCENQLTIQVTVCFWAELYSVCLYVYPMLEDFG